MNIQNQLKKDTSIHIQTTKKRNATPKVRPQIQEKDMKQQKKSVMKQKKYLENVKINIIN